LDHYFREVSYGKFGIDIDQSVIYPSVNEGSYQLSNQMNYYHPYSEDNLHEKRITSLFVESVEKAYDDDGIEFNSRDLVVVIHAGIGQDFSLPFLDPTPEDIPSTYIDPEMLLNYHEGPVVIGNSIIEHGIILPETQNHLLFDIAKDMFASSETPCEYQFGLTGTFSLMVGFAIGLPPMWNVESGESGIGVFGLMDQGSNNGRGLIPAPPNAWTRIYAGWETPRVVRPELDVYLSSRSENNIVQVNINNREYYLIENRTNWHRNKVSIDSSRFLIYNQNGRDRYPPFVEVLFDSVNIEMDTNGVVISIPDYDLGFSASGLLIWHIDEDRIELGLNTYSINGDRESRGIDLEEADGAQDIGYPNIFLFSDPTTGYFGDMWFQGNPEYVRLYPDYKELPIEFGPFTYPNTKSNDGATTYLSINQIGMPGDTMSFSITNSLLVNGLPDTSLHIGLVYDFDDNGINEIVGGIGELWVGEEMELSKRTTFYQTPNVIYDFSIGTFDGEDKLVISERDGSSSVVSYFSWNPVSNILELINQQTMNSPYILFINEGNNSHLYLENPQESELDTKVIYEDNSLDSVSGISWVSLADIDLDGSPEYVYNNGAGKLSVEHMNGITFSGFPMEVRNSGKTALIKNIIGDSHPEIIIQNSAGEIVIINWKGNIEYRLTNYGSLVCLSDYNGRNAVVTESAIWVFNLISENFGNEWTSTHHDFGNSRTLQLQIPKRIPDTSLIDKKKTYAYPNPAYRGNVTFRVAVESAENVEIIIYDFAGYFVKRYKMTNLVPGIVHERNWNIDKVESGVYFVNVTATKGTETDLKILKIGIIK